MRRQAKKTNRKAKAMNVMRIFDKDYDVEPKFASLFGICLLGAFAHLKMFH